MTFHFLMKLHHILSYVRRDQTIGLLADVGIVLKWA